MNAAVGSILVVDDDTDVRSSLRRVLQSAGHHVSEAGDAWQARICLPDPKLDLMISDLDMPGHDGMWLLRESLSIQPELPVIMLTGNADVTSAVECLKLGALDYLAKPAHAVEVQARASSAIAQRRIELDYRRLQATYQEQLEQQVNALSRRNEQMFLGQVRMAVRMLEAKDLYTKGHSERVAAYSHACAVQLGVVPEILLQIRLGGSLHDIGKIGTRDAVLNKPGRLSEAEFAEIRRHTTDGEQMLEVLREDHPHVLQIVRSHHERMDGSGFPDGLMGETIPFSARIVAVCDAYDAMTTTRSYRPEQPIDWALDELRRCAGELFDPQVVEVFLDLHANLQWPTHVG